MNLRCQSAACHNRHLAQVTGVTSGAITLCCPTCGGKNTFHFSEDDRCRRTFEERKREGEQVSKLKRESLAPRSRTAV